MSGITRRGVVDRAALIASLSAVSLAVPDPTHLTYPTYPPTCPTCPDRYAENDDH